MTGAVDRPGIVLLGRLDHAGRLRYLGRTTRLPADQARALGAVLRSASPGHPWEGRRFSVSWASRDTLPAVLVEPEVVAEVSVDLSRVANGGWRHSVRWVRLRPDLTTSDLPGFEDDT